MIHATAHEQRSNQTAAWVKKQPNSRSSAVVPPSPFYKAKILAASHKFGMQLSARTDHTQHLSFSSPSPRDQGTRIHLREEAFPLLHLAARRKETTQERRGGQGEADLSLTGRDAADEEQASNGAQSASPGPPPALALAMAPVVVRRRCRWWWWYWVWAGDDVMQPEMDTGMGGGANPKRIMRGWCALLPVPGPSLLSLCVPGGLENPGRPNLLGPGGGCRGAISAVGPEDRDAGLK